MPTKSVTANQMNVGRKGSGKHWTQKQVESRQKAEEMGKRKTKVRLVAPPWLSEEALRVWNRVKRQAAGLELLDNLDAEMLAVYCDAVVQYREESERLKYFDVAVEGNTRMDLVKSIQSWARLISSYADKLGFTPSGRARLAKKRADEIEKDEFGTKFD